MSDWESADGWESAEGWETAPSSSSKGMYSDANTPVQGALEAGMSFLAGMPSQIAAGVEGFNDAYLAGPLERMLGMDTERARDPMGYAARKVQKRQEQNFGFGQYTPSSETGKEYTEKVGNVLEYPVNKAGEFGEMVGGNAGRFAAELLTESAMELLPLDIGARGGKALIKKAGQTTPNAKVDKIDQIIQERSQAKVQPKVDADGWETAQGDLFEPNIDAGGMRSPYGDPRKAQWTTDENGIPIRQELSTEAQLVQNPLQRDLFDSEAPGGMSESLDKYQQFKQAEGKAREAMNLPPVGDTNPMGLRGQVDASGELQAAKMAAEGRALDASLVQNQRLQTEKLGDIQKTLKEIDEAIREDSMTASVPKSQRGGLNLTEISEGLDKIRQRFSKFKVEVENTSNGVMVRLKTPDDKLSGFVDFARREDGTLVAENAQVAKDLQGKGAAKRMYIAAREAGFDIAPGRVQTAQGKQMVDSLQKYGIINKEAKGPRFDAGNLNLAPLEGERLPGARYIPKSQRGALDFGPNKVKVKKTTDEVISSNIPGMKEALKDYIPNDPTPESIIEAAKNEKDSGMKYTGLQSGASLTSIKTGSSLIQGIGRLYQNATKRAERNIRNFVMPAERQFNSIVKRQVGELAEVFKKEMFNGERLSLDDLRQAGYTTKQIEAYQATRKMFDEALDAMNDSRLEMGLDPVTPKQAYLSSRWQGSWKTPVYNKEGKLVWYIAENSKARVEKALNYLEKNGFDIDRSKSKIEFKGQGKEKGDLHNAYLTMLEVIDPKDERALALKSIMEDGMANDAFSALGQSKHFENKGNIRGFVGDRPWVNRSKDSYEMFKQQFQYAKNAFDWAEKNKASQKAKQVLADEELNTTQPNNMAYAREYAKNQLGFGENKHIAALEGQLAKAMGVDRNLFYKAIGDAKSFFLTTKLSMSLGYMTASVLQPLYSAAWHSDLSSKGFKHNAGRTFSSAMLDASAGYLAHTAETAIGKRPDLKMTEIGKEALKYAEDNGIVDLNIYDESSGLGKNKVIEGIEKTLGKTISEPEKYARLMAFMSYVHHLDQSGVFQDRATLFQKAEDLTNAQMVDYRRGERPMIFEQGGIVGNAAATLQTFKFNYFNQLHYFADQWSKGNKAPMTYFLGTTLALGGALAIPFISEADDAWEFIKANILPDAMAHEVKDFGIKKFLIENMGDWAYGGVSKLTGANLSTRFEPQALPEFSFDGAFPFITDLYKQGQAVAQFATNPNETTGAQAAYAVTPPGLQGLVETEMDAFKAGNTQDGRTIYQNPRKLTEHKYDYARTPEQELYRKLGLRELSEAKYKELKFREGSTDRLMETRRNAQVSKIFDAGIRGDKEAVKKYVKLYTSYGGNPESLAQTFEQRLLQMKVPQETLDAISASTPGSYEKVQRYMELLKK